MIGIIKEQFIDILQAMQADFTFNLYEETKPNKYGGNPETVVYFNNVSINGIPYKDKIFKWQRSAQTENGFYNEIKSYLFDVLDGVSNL